MGMYTGLRAKLTIKEEFWPVIERLMTAGQDYDRGLRWQLLADEFPQYPFLMEWANVERCDFIPFGALSYMPWDREDPHWQHSFENGLWVFQCSLKNYWREIEEFVHHVLPHMVDIRHELYSLYEENDEPTQLFIPEVDDES